MDVMLIWGILVFNVFFFNICFVVELIIVEIVMLMCGVFLKFNGVYVGCWMKMVVGFCEVCGKIFGIIGYGNIGI